MAEGHLSVRARPVRDAVGDERRERAHCLQGVQVEVLCRHVDAVPALDLPEQQCSGQGVQPDAATEQGGPRRDAAQLVKDFELAAYLKYVTIYKDEVKGFCLKKGENYSKVLDDGPNA